MFKYIRDCFAHDPDGELFPPWQHNTIRFSSSINNHPELKVIITNRKLNITSTTVRQSFNFFQGFLRETIT